MPNNPYPRTPVKGEVLATSRAEWLIGIFLICSAVPIASAYLHVLSMPLLGQGTPRPLSRAVEIGCHTLAFSGTIGFCCAGWYQLRRQPRLILGEDRLQYWAGKQIRWEVAYNHVTHMAPAP